MGRLTITEAAARLRVSTDSIRRRLRKGELTAVRDNRGQWWLDLPDDVQPEAPALSVEDRLAPAMLAPTLAPAQRQPMQPDLALTDALRGQVADLSGRLDRAEAREVVTRAEADQVRQEREDARVRAASAEGEAGALREALAEARRPAWQRWLGRP